MDITHTMKNVLDEDWNKSCCSNALDFLHWLNGKTEWKLANAPFASQAVGLGPSLGYFYWNQEAGLSKV